MRRSTVLIAAIAGGLAYLLRRRRRPRGERVDLYYDDASMVSLEAGVRPADRLLSLATDALAAARGA